MTGTKRYSYNTIRCSNSELGKFRPTANGIGWFLPWDWPTWKVWPAKELTGGYCDYWMSSRLSNRAQNTVFQAIDCSLVDSSWSIHLYVTYRSENSENIPGIRYGKQTPSSGNWANHGAAFLRPPLTKKGRASPCCYSGTLLSLFPISLPGSLSI